MAETPVVRRVRVVAAVVWDGPLLLITQRPPGGPLGLQWEFPGGKLETGESPEVALVREVGEELGVAANAHETLAVHAHDYSHGLRVEVTFILCTLASHTFTPSAAVHAHRWLDPREIPVDDMLEGDRAFVRALAGRGNGE